jgi:hypothetical protein
MPSVAARAYLCISKEIGKAGEHCERGHDDRGTQRPLPIKAQKGIIAAPIDGAKVAVKKRWGRG